MVGTTFTIKILLEDWTFQSMTCFWLLFPKEVKSPGEAHNSFLPLEIPDYRPSLPETNSEFTPENWWDWKTVVFFWVSVTFLGTMLVSGSVNHQHTGRVVPWGSRTEPTHLSLFKKKVGCRAATSSDNNPLTRFGQNVAHQKFNLPSITLPFDQNTLCTQRKMTSPPETKKAGFYVKGVRLCNFTIMKLPLGAKEGSTRPTWASKWWWKVREMAPLISGKSRLVKYDNLAGPLVSP